MNAISYFNLLLGLLLLPVSSLWSQALPAADLSSAPCECEVKLDPTFTWQHDAENCITTFTADPGPESACLTSLRYLWSVNNGPYVSTGSNPVYEYNDAANLGYVELVTYARGSDEECKEFYGLAINDLLCSFNDLIVTKEAYRHPNPGQPLNDVYINQLIEWRVTIINEVPGEFVSYEDFFPDGSEDPACPFTIESVVVLLDGNPYPLITIDVSDPTNISGTMTLPVGTLTISFITRACPDGQYVGEEFENCFQIDTDPLSTDFNNRVPQLVCDEVVLRYGCPITLTDGFCLEPEDLKAGEIINSKFSGHTRFLNITKMEGDLSYDSNIFAAPSFELAPLIASTFTITLTNNGPGLTHFVIEGIGDASFDIRPASEGGTWNPFSVNGVLLEDLLDCTALYIDDFTLTNDIDFERTIYIDPGNFCNIYPDGDYESAHIVLPAGENCVGNEPLTLTAIGPFESQHPNTSFLWSTGEVTSSIDVSSGGVYSVAINDNHNCDRSATIDLTECVGVDCPSCAEINPVIVYSNNAECAVVASVLMPDCSNVTNISYYWRFSNGQTYDGAFPPPQHLPIYDNKPEIVLVMGFFVDNIKCDKTITKDVYPCNTGGGVGGRGLRIFPNPSTGDQVNISLSEAALEGGQLEIYNSYGQRVSHKVLDTWGTDVNTTLNVSDLSPGVYWVKFTDHQGIQSSVETFILK